MSFNWWRWIENITIWQTWGATAGASIYIILMGYIVQNCCYTYDLQFYMHVNFIKSFGYVSIIHNFKYNFQRSQTHYLLIVLQTWFSKHVHDVQAYHVRILIQSHEALQKIWFDRNIRIIPMETLQHICDSFHVYLRLWYACRTFCAVRKTFIGTYR